MKSMRVLLNEKSPDQRAKNQHKCSSEQRNLMKHSWTKEERRCSKDSRTSFYKELVKTIDERIAFKMCVDEGGDLSLIEVFLLDCSPPPPQWPFIELTQQLQLKNNNAFWFCCRNRSCQQSEKNFIDQKNLSDRTCRVQTNLNDGQSVLLD